MRRALVALALCGALAIAATVVLRDPEQPGSVAIVAAGAGALVGAIAALVLTARAKAGRRSREQRGSLALGARRGLELGAFVAVAAYLRAIDGLTPLTVVVVALPFVAAEVALSARLRSG